MNFKSSGVKTIFRLLILGYGIISVTLLQITSQKKDGFLSTITIIRKYGYPAETHTVTTEDGYILSLHRIPHGKYDKKSDKNFPVFILHGFQGTSAGYVVLGPDSSLGFLLADAGYDVWLGNFRGNNYASTHVTLHPTQSRFWNFSWHEHGIYDLPASIDYICNHTKAEKLIYIGYSMGSTSFIVMAAEKPKYQDKIQVALLMALSTFLNNIKFPVKMINLLDLIPPLDIILHRKFGSQSAFHKKLVKVFCGQPKYINICFAILQIAVGFDRKGWPGDKSENIFSHFPGGTSIKNLVHFGQIAHSGKFRQFDYKKKNKLHYGKNEPPEYNTSNIYTSLNIFEGLNDKLSVPKDVKTNLLKLKSIRRIEYVNNPHFNHVDFLYSKFANTTLYHRILTIINEIENETRQSIN